MSEEMRSYAYEHRLWILGAVVVICGFVAISQWFYDYSQDTFIQWLSTLVGTLLGAFLAAVVGVALFYYQKSVTEERRRLQLLSAMAAELEATLDILDKRHALTIEAPPRSKEEAVEVVVTRLAPVACDEHIRNALLTPEDTFFLVHLHRNMHMYDSVAERLSSIMSEPALDEKELYQLKVRSYKAAKELRNHQNGVVNYCQRIIPALQSKGVQMPAVSRYYSPPNETDSED